MRDGSPRGLTLVYAAGQGDGRRQGLNHLAHAILLRRVIEGHWGLCPRLGELAIADQVEAYNFPQGVICQLFRDLAAGRPGCITHVGIGTFIDPLQGGGMLNSRTTEPLVTRLALEGRDWLWYRLPRLDVGLIRGTAADPHGGILMADEAVAGEVLPIAQAVRNNGGIVIAQVARIFDAPGRPQAIRVPGILADKIVVASEGEHDQTFGERHNPSFNEPRLPASGPAGLIGPPLPLDERRVITSRACDELVDGAVANLGIGIPQGIGRIAAERDLLHRCTVTLEAGPIGGMPAGGLSFNATVRPHAIIDQPAQFNFYDIGGLCPGSP